MFQTKVVEKIKTYFMFNKFTFFPSSSKFVPSIMMMWKYMSQADRSQMTVLYSACAFLMNN